MRKNYETIKGYTNSWYSMTPNRLLVTLGPLKGEVNSDVCVVGAGFTGLSAALELAQKGYAVTLIDAGTVAGGASGRNGGHLQRGFAQSPSWAISRYGIDAARMLGNISLEGLALILERITKHDIKCDLKFGHVTCAIKEKHVPELKTEIKAWEKIGHTDLRLLDKNELQEFVKSPKYIGGMYDPKGGHFHPLNYALGLAVACQKAGVKIYDETKATQIITSPSPRVVTTAGAVNAKFVLLAGAYGMKGAESIGTRSITAMAHMIATEPLGEKRARDILPKDVAAIDANFIMNYYRLSSDYRLLFGGNCNYSGKDFSNEDDELRARMIDTFPSLKMTRIDHCWHGPLDLTVNRMPHLGRLSPQVFFAHGFGGHGVIATNILGKIMADAVAGTAERFDVFTKIRHTPFLGGNLLRRPLFVMGMTWYKLRDLL